MFLVIFVRTKQDYYDQFKTGLIFRLYRSFSHFYSFLFCITTLGTLHRLGELPSFWHKPKNCLHHPDPTTFWNPHCDAHSIYGSLAFSIYRSVWISFSRIYRYDRGFLHFKIETFEYHSRLLFGTHHLVFFGF